MITQIKTTPTGIVRVYCSKCKKLQISIQPKSGYKVMDNGKMPLCERCNIFPTIKKMTVDKKGVKIITKGVKIKQKNRNKYKKRRTSNRTLKS